MTINGTLILMLFLSYQYTLCASVAVFCVWQYYRDLQVRCQSMRIIVAKAARKRQSETLRKRLSKLNSMLNQVVAFNKLTDAAQEADYG